jgi:hypothetical protein
MTGREIGEKGRHGEGREAPDATLIVVRTASTIAGKPPMPDAITVAVRSSECASDGVHAACATASALATSAKQDEAIHPALILGSNDRIRIEASSRIARLCRHDSSDPRGQGSRPFGKGRQP